MSAGWSWWVIGLIIFNLGVVFLLFIWAPWAKVPTLPDGTTGHAWAHGELREGMQRLPRWWIALSVALFITAVIYLVLYPGFGNRKGLLDWTAQREYAAAVATNRARLDPEFQHLATMSVEEAARDPRTQQLGERLYVDNCAACHGREARGNLLLGAPDLTDSDWLYGGSGNDIVTSIRVGRSGVMPAWGALGADTTKNLVQYVMGLAGQTHDAERASAGEQVFKTTCIACHGLDGKGNRALGAPNLTDQVWLYGGTPAALEESIVNGRQGRMPMWSPRLSDAEIHVLAAYVYRLSQPETNAAH